MIGQVVIRAGTEIKQGRVVKQLCAPLGGDPGVKGCRVGGQGKWMVLR